MSHKPLLLLVEDDADLLDVLIDLTRDYDIRVVARRDGEEGLQAALKMRPDAILTDINMPKKNGIEMLLELRRAGIETPVVILTGHADRQNTLDALRLGVFDFLEKPFDNDKLMRLLQECLDYGVRLREFETAWQAHLRDDTKLQRQSDDLIRAKKQIMGMRSLSSRRKASGS